MREMGSEFWDIPLINADNGLFPNNTQWFLSGRSALHAIIKELRNAKCVSLPSWCCETMIKPFLDEGFTVHFYPVYWRNGLKQELSFDDDVLVIMDYFGYSPSKIDISGYGGVVIRDVTHSLFSNSYTDADYYYGSLRKWCGVWTGGYMWTQDGHKLPVNCNEEVTYISLRRKAMQLKREYIYGERKDKNYLKVFNEAEKLLDGIDIACAADRDVTVAKTIDVEAIRNQRRKNAQLLCSVIPDWLIFEEIPTMATPMFVPVLIPDGKRDQLRRFLSDHDIYCPIHWPSSRYHKLNDDERFLYENELSFVCDQRYSEEDMNRLSELIKLFWKDV